MVDKECPLLKEGAVRHEFSETPLVFKLLTVLVANEILLEEPISINIKPTDTLMNKVMLHTNIIGCQI